MTKAKDISGKRFGRLIAIEKVGKNKHNQFLWDCACDCGGKKVTTVANLFRGRTRSCGCLQKEATSKNIKKALEASVSSNTKHNRKPEKLYGLWRRMKARCYYKKNDSYPWYGAKGITVCDEWLDDFCAFRDWALSNGYRPNDSGKMNSKCTLDRIDPRGNYCPENCRFVDMARQSRNRTSNIIVDGLVLIDWCEANGQDYRLVAQRRSRGWSLERAIYTVKRNVSVKRRERP